MELLARVKSMMRRYTSLGSIAEKNNVIRIGDVELDKDAKEVRVNGKLVKMTATEYGILQLLMENLVGKVFSIDRDYERPWKLSSAGKHCVSGTYPRTSGEKNREIKSEGTEISEGGVGDWLQNRKNLSCID